MNASHFSPTPCVSLNTHIVHARRSTRSTSPMRPSSPPQDFQFLRLVGSFAEVCATLERLSALEASRR